MKNIKCPNCGEMVPLRGACMECYKSTWSCIEELFNNGEIEEDVNFTGGVYYRLGRKIEKTLEIDVAEKTAEITNFMGTKKKNCRFVKDNDSSVILMESSYGYKIYDDFLIDIQELEKPHKGNITLNNGMLSGERGNDYWVCNFNKDGTIKINANDGSYSKDGEYTILNNLVKINKKISNNNIETIYYLFYKNKLFERFLVKADMLSAIESMKIERGSGVRKNDEVYKKFFEQRRCPKCGSMNWKNIWGNNNYVMADCGRCDCPYDAYITDDGMKDVDKTREFRADVDRELEKTIPSLKQKEKYLNLECPFCGKWTVRAMKWDDMKFSIAFWGLFAPKAHDHYKCDSCKRSWR